MIRSIILLLSVSAFLGATALASETPSLNWQEQRKECWFKTGVLGKESWNVLESKNADTDSETHRLIEGDRMAFRRVCVDVAEHRFDGEKAEFRTLLLVYFDCKRGDEVLLRDLREQSASTRKGVALVLLHAISPSANPPAASCQQKLSDGLKELLP